MADSDTKSRQRNSSPEPDRGRQRDHRNEARSTGSGSSTGTGPRRTPRPRQVVVGPRRRTGGTPSIDPMEAAYNSPEIIQPTIINPTEPPTSQVLAGSGLYDREGESPAKPKTQTAAEKEAASRSVMGKPLSLGDILKRAMGGTS